MSEAKEFVAFTATIAFNDKTYLSTDFFDLTATDICGDGNVTGREQCDDNNTANGDGCDEFCHIEICGNSYLQINEQCDDGNLINGDGCSSICLIEFCGDNIIQIQLGEECDPPNATCTPPYDGSCTYCNATCNLITLYDGYCGDGNLDTPYEECDDNNTDNNDGCSSTCKDEFCGDGIKQLSEQCDDGNNQDGDGCDFNCNNETWSLAYCGDGVLWLYYEECDLNNFNQETCATLLGSNYIGDLSCINCTINTDGCTAKSTSGGGKGKGYSSTPPTDQACTSQLCNCPTKDACIAVGCIWENTKCVKSSVPRASAPSCISEWSCLALDKCINGLQTWTCTDLNKCNPNYVSYTEQRECKMSEERKPLVGKAFFISPFMQLFWFILLILGIVAIVLYMILHHEHMPHPKYTPKEKETIKTISKLEKHLKKIPKSKKTHKLKRGIREELSKYKKR